MARPSKGDMCMKIVSFRTTKKAASGKKTSAARPTRPTAARTLARPAAPRRTVRRKRRNLRPWILVGGLLAVIWLAIFVQQSLLHRWQADAGLTYIGDIPVHEDFLPEGYAARPGEKRVIEYVVIHETDNVNEGADAQAHNSFLHNSGADTELSWHYTVDDHEIWHHIPDDETAFHAGDHMAEDGGNKNGIGVEMCVNADGDYEQTLRNAQKLAATLLHEYGLSIDALKKHQDFSGKNCPSQLLDAGRWDEFVQGVQDELDKL